MLLTHMKDIAKDIVKNKWVSLDTETTGLLWTDVPFSIQISTRTYDLYLNMNPDPDPVISPPGTYIPKEVVKAFLEPLFARKDLIWFIQNATFDTVMLKKHLGLNLLGQIHCTQAIGRLIDSSHMKYSLDAMAEREGIGKKDDAVKKYIQKHKLYGEGKTPKYNKVPYEIMRKYGIQDTRLTHILGCKQLKKVFADSDLKAVWENEVKLARVCHKMEMLGVKVDIPYAIKAREYHQHKSDLLRYEYKKTAGAEFVDSALQIKKHIPVEYAGVTKKGNPSYDKDSLAKCEHPLAKFILQIREHENLIKNFYDKLITLHVKGVVHPSINRGSTVTGRFSYSSPNFQNFPKDEDYEGKEFLARRCIIPRAGKYLVSLDYDQQEFRLMLDYAGERALIERIVNEGLDVHQATADMIGTTRKYAKTIGFGLLYGLGQKSLADALGVSLYEAKRMRLQYFASLPRVERLINSVKHTALARGNIKNWLGRRYTMNDARFAYRFINYLIQGSGADIMRVAMVEVDKYIRKSRLDMRMLISVHDEIVFEVPGSELIRIPEIQRVMENVYPSKNGMKLTTSASWSQKSWAQNDQTEFKGE